MATYEITNAVRVTGTSRAPPRPSCRTFADRHFSSFHWNSWTKGSTEGNGTYGTTSSQQNKIKEHLPKSQKHHAKYHRKLLIYSISTPSCGALANGWTHFLGICEQFPLKVWMVFFSWLSHIKDHYHQIMVHPQKRFPPVKTSRPVLQSKYQPLRKGFKG